MRSCCRRARAEHEDVDVDRARAVAPGGPGATQLALEPLDGIEQLERTERGAHAQARVQEARLIEHLADRIGVVGGGAREHLHSRRRAAHRPRPADARGARRRSSPSRAARARPRRPSGHGGPAQARVVSRPASVTFSPIACANGTSPESGRSSTVKSAIRPSSSKRSRSMPSSSRPATLARKTSACVSPQGELVGVAEVLERLPRRVRAAVSRSRGPRTGGRSRGCGRRCRARAAPTPPPRPCSRPPPGSRLRCSSPSARSARRARACARHLATS